ncbi:recombinase family protein [Sedimentibacter sp. B4]
MPTWKGTFTITKDLNSKGVKSVTGGKWHDNTVRGMLKNDKL